MDTGLLLSIPLPARVTEVGAPSGGVMQQRVELWKRVYDANDNAICKSSVDKVGYLPTGFASLEYE